MRLQVNLDTLSLYHAYFYDETKIKLVPCEQPSIMKAKRVTLSENNEEEDDPYDKLIY